MGKIVIGVHGLGNKPAADILYPQGWKKAMLEGMSLNENSVTTDFDFNGVYWASVNYPEVDGDGETYRPAVPGELKSYDEGFVEDVVQAVERAGGNILDWFKEKLNINNTADLILEKKLGDLHKYYSDAENYNHLTGLVMDEIAAHSDKTILLIGHSMGSIIAYDALRRLGRESSNVMIDHFITIGSPLGLPHVVAKCREKHGSIRTPTIVKRWTNFADRRDPVATDEHLRDDYKPNSAGVRVEDNLVLNDWRVESGVDIFHKSYGYLRTPEFSKVLAEFV